MKLKLKSKTIENVTATLPEKTSETLERISKAQPKKILSDGAVIDGPSFEGQETEPVADDGPHPYPDIVVNQFLEVEADNLAEAQLQAFEQAAELIANFADVSEYQPLVISDDDGSNERTFTNVSLISYKYNQLGYAWNLDGKGGLAGTTYRFPFDIYFRGIEQEKE